MNEKNSAVTEELQIDETFEAPEGVSDALTLDHTILEVWQKILGGAESEANLRISAAAANGLLRSWPQMNVQDLPVYSDKFYDHMDELNKILTGIIEQDPDSLKQAADDAEMNREIYLEVSLAWNDYFDEEDRKWDCLQHGAVAHMAALADAANFAVTDDGLLGYLRQIGLEYTLEEVTQATLRRRGEATTGEAA